MIDTDRYDNLTTDTTFRALALDWLNRTLKNISAMQEGFHWRFLEATATFPTVAAQSSYSLPTDIDGHKVYTVTQTTDDRKLDFVPQDQVDKYLPDPTVSSGNPKAYTLWDSSIRLMPIPSSIITMTMRYVKTITALTDAAVSSEIPAKWDDVVLQGMLAKAYKFDKRLDDAVDAQNHFLAGIERMKSDNAMVIDYVNIADSHKGLNIYPTWKSPAGI
jgi:hypothetical protein